MIGVLALQGDFAEHIAALKAVGSRQRLVRSLADVVGITGLILPGGESTTIGKLLISTKLDQWIIKQAKAGLPIYGTCAGCILIAKTVDSPYTLKLIDITVQRNAYGRQLDSFESSLNVEARYSVPLGTRIISGMFIRAPKITAVGHGVSVLIKYHSEPVLVQQGNILAGTFHPELTNNLAVHRYFVSLTA